MYGGEVERWQWVISMFWNVGDLLVDESLRDINAPELKCQIGQIGEGAYDVWPYSHITAKVHLSWSNLTQDIHAVWMYAEFLPCLPKRSIEEGSIRLSFPWISSYQGPSTQK